MTIHVVIQRAVVTAFLCLTVASAQNSGVAPDLGGESVQSGSAHKGKDHHYVGMAVEVVNVHCGFEHCSTDLERIRSAAVLYEYQYRAH
jgi:hypothetical protein